MMLRNEYRDVISIAKEWGEIPPFYCYPGKLNQVFVNVLRNAIDAIKSKTTLTESETITIRTAVVVRNGKQFAEIEVSDTGPGIPDDIRDRIFEPFFSSKEVGKGNGLGLPISLSIVESHGGVMEAVPGDSRGTTFRIYLPLKFERTGHESGLA